MFYKNLNKSTLKIKPHMQHLYCARRTVSDEGGGGGVGEIGTSYTRCLYTLIQQSGSCCPNVFLRALGAYERAGVKNFTKKIARQKSSVDYTLAFEFVVVESKFRQIDTITQRNWDLPYQKKNNSAKFRGKSVNGSYTYP
jgi:hypothetical protein